MSLQLDQQNSDPPPSPTRTRTTGPGPTDTMSTKFLTCLLLAFALTLAWVPSPAQAWYKQAAGPSYYSVGRASGLLSGIRRSPYVRRAELEPADSGDESAGNSVLSELSTSYPVLKTMSVCLRDVTPNLLSCELLQEPTASFRCRAQVVLSLDSADCAGNSARK